MKKIYWAYSALLLAILSNCDYKGKEPYQGVDFTKKADSAIGKIEGNGQTELAKKLDGALIFTSNSQEWNEIKLQTRALGGKEQECFFMHPLTNSVKSLSFENVKLGRKVLFNVGLVDEAPEGAPVVFTTTVGSKSQSVTLSNESKYLEAELSTLSLSGKEETVRFEVTTEDDRARWVCFNAETA